MWKRLESAGQTLSLRAEQVVIVFSRYGDSDSDLDKRIERWKAGEKVEGICSEYEGGDIRISRIGFVSPGDIQRGKAKAK